MPRRGLVGWSGDRKPLPEAPQRVKSQSKKDTKRWCKGVVGREHKTVVKGWNYPLSVTWNWACDECTVCGKRMRLRKVQVHCG